MADTVDLNPSFRHPSRNFCVCVCVLFKKDQATNSLIIKIMDEIESEKQPNKLPLSETPPDTQPGEVILSENGIVLHPQAVDDALDPLNWTSFQKHTILAIVMAL